MSEHTKEPWQVGQSLAATSSMERTPIYAADGNMIGLAFDAHDARRIAACVNACAGISTDTLELVPRFEEAGVKTIQAVEAQRDELLASLKKARSALAAAPTRAPEFKADYEAANAAIAKATGGAA